MRPRYLAVLAAAFIAMACACRSEAAPRRQEGGCGKSPEARSAKGQRVSLRVVVLYGGAPGSSMAMGRLESNEDCRVVLKVPARFVLAEKPTEGREGQVVSVSGTFDGLTQFGEMVVVMDVAPAAAREEPPEAVPAVPGGAIGLLEQVSAKPRDDWGLEPAPAAPDDWGPIPPAQDNLFARVVLPPGVEAAKPEVVLPAVRKEAKVVLGDVVVSSGDKEIAERVASSLSEMLSVSPWVKMVRPDAPEILHPMHLKGSHIDVQAWRDAGAEIVIVAMTGHEAPGEKAMTVFRVYRTDIRGSSDNALVLEKRYDFEPSEAQDVAFRFAGAAGNLIAEFAKAESARLTEEARAKARAERQAEIDRIRAETERVRAERVRIQEETERVRMERVRMQMDRDREEKERRAREASTAATQPVPAAPAAADNAALPVKASRPEPASPAKAGAKNEEKRPAGKKAKPRKYIVAPPDPSTL